MRSQSEFSSLPWMMYSAGRGDELLVLVVLSVINKAALSLTVGMAPLKLNGGDPTKNLLGMLLGGGGNGTKEVPGVEVSSPAVARDQSMMAASH